MLLPDGILPPCVRSGLSREVGLDGIKDFQVVWDEKRRTKRTRLERVRKEEIKHIFTDLPANKLPHTDN